jgi:pyruvate dehydrogenase E2 component (dihydrolipoamide acetyltransferase)
VTKIIVSLGDKLSVGQPILSLDGNGAPAPAGKPAAAKPQPAERRASAPAPKARLEEEPEPEADPDAAEEEAPTGTEPAAPPSIRRMARELGIDLRKIRGSEHGGRIVIGDVRAYIQRLQKLAAQPRGAATAAGTPKPAPAQIDFSKWGPIAKRPLTPLRKVIAERMGQSWNAVPRVTQFDEADVTKLEELRKKYAPAFEKKGVRLTLTSFALKIVANALKKNPVFNTSLDEAAGELIWKEYFHLGLAVDTEQGLIVPVLRDVDKKNLVDLSKELGDLATKTRDRKIGLEELQGGSFTISNQGGIGGGHFTPIINLPEVAILGLGRGALKPVVRDGAVTPRLMLPLALSYDHRVIDGGAAVRFILEIVKGFENFDEKELA